MNDFEWIGTDGQRKRGISKERAESLVRSRGGQVNELPQLEAVIRQVVLQPIAPSAASSVGARDSYGRGIYNGD